jgi:hypothetical protein
MPISTTRDEKAPNTIIFKFAGIWSWDEFYTASRASIKLMTNRETPIHIVFDMREGQIPLKSPILHLRYFVASLPRPAQQGLMVHVGASKYWLIAVSTFNRIYSKLACDTVFVSDLDAAREAIARKEEQLAILSED